MKQNIVKLTNEVGTELFHGEAERPFVYMSENLTFIGPFESSVGHGIEEFRAYVFKTGLALSALRFATVALDELFSDRNITIMLHVSTGSVGQGDPLVRVRSTYVWDTSEADRPRIVHLHSSIPVLEHEDIAVHPYIVTSAHEGESMAKDDVVRPTEQLMVRDVEGIAHAIDFDEILYAEAAHQYVVVHLSRASIRTRKTLTAITACLPSIFVRVHRRYTVNALAVRTFGNGGLTMINGDRIPVPARRRHEIRLALRAARGNIGTWAM